MFVFETQVGTVNPSSTTRYSALRPFANSFELRMTIPEKETSLKMLAFYFACFYHNWSEIVFLGNFNVQAFRVQEFPLVG